MVLSAAMMDSNWSEFNVLMAVMFVSMTVVFIASMMSRPVTIGYSKRKNIVEIFAGASTQVSFSIKIIIPLRFCLNATSTFVELLDSSELSMAAPLAKLHAK